MSHSRFNSIGLSGRKAGTYNVTDSRIKTIEIPVVASATASQIDTGVKINNKVQCISAFVVIDTAEATGTTKTLNVGVFGGTAAGFLSAVSCAATGVAGTPVSAAYDTSTNDTIGYTFGSADWAEFAGTIHLTLLVAD